MQAAQGLHLVVGDGEWRPEKAVGGEVSSFNFGDVVLLPPCSKSNPVRSYDGGATW